MSEKHLLMFIKEAVEQVQPNDTFSFLQGIEHALAEFAVWRSGDRFFGVEEHTTRELAAAIKTYVEEQK